MANQVVATLAGRFGPVLAERAVRRVQPRDPPKVSALKPLSMRAIAEARHLLSAKYISLQGLLPPPVLEELMVSPRTRAMRTDPEHLRLVLSSLSRRCSLNIPFALPRWEQPCPLSVRTRRQLGLLGRKLEDLAALVLHTAKAQIRTLEVGELEEEEEENSSSEKARLVEQLTPELRGFLHRLLEGLTELHELRVVSWPDVVTDHTLQIIAQRHTSLKKLVVRCSEKSSLVSDQGVRPLVTRCSRLQHLELPGFKPGGGTLTDVLPLMARLDTLSGCEPRSMGRALYQYAMQHPQHPPLQLNTKVRLDPSCELRDRHQVTRLFSTIPNVTGVDLPAVNEETAIGLLQTTNQFKVLILAGTQAISLDTQTRLLEKLSQSLTYLKIHNDFIVCDLGLIAQLCLSLKHIAMRTVLSVGADYEIKEEQFAKLVSCKLFALNPDFSPPPELVRRVFSSPRLHRLSLRAVAVPGHVVTQVCAQASHEQRGPLSALEYMWLGEVDGLYTEHVIALVCAAPRLAELRLSASASLSSQDAHHIRLFCRKVLRKV